MSRIPLSAILGALAFASVSVCSAQSLGPTAPGDLPDVESASIRRNVESGSTRSGSRFTPGRFVATASTLRDLIRIAYGVSVDSQIQGGPSWLASTRFDVQVTANEVSQERMRLVLRRLLIERFGLKLRVITEERPVFALTLQSGGQISKLALRPIAPCLNNTVPAGIGQSPCGQILLIGNGLMADAVSIARFAEVLSRSPSITGADRLVTDRTELSGLYSFKLEFARKPTYGLRIPPSEGLPEFTAALEEQLGLRLEPTRGRVDVLVIDSVQQPTEN